jgi:hypothetical protein
MSNICTSAKPIPRRLFIRWMIATCAAMNSRCLRHPAAKLPLPASLQPPTHGVRPIDATLVKFAAMVRAHRPDDRDLLIEIDYLPNQSGVDKEIPDNLSSYAESVLATAGRPFLTCQTLDASTQLRGPAGNSWPLVRTPQKCPDPAFKIEGTLRRASEQTVLGGNVQAAGQGGGGKTKWDGSASRDHSRTITSVSVSLNVETPDRLSVRGANATYKITVERNERNRSLSIFIAGNGISGGKKLIVTQDLGDALYDATAACLMHVLGHALLIPYYRTSSVFAPDQALDDHFRSTLNRMPRAQLEQKIKLYLFVNGKKMDMTSPSLTDADRNLVVEEMTRRSLDFKDRAGLVDFAFHLWKDLDYLEGAKRVDDALAKSVVTILENPPQSKNATPESPVELQPWGSSPIDFGWDASVRMVVLDLSAVKEIKTREKILAAARKCNSCSEIRTNPDKTIAGIRVASQLSEAQSAVQLALRRSRLALDYQWTIDAQPRLVLSLK